MDLDYIFRGVRSLGLKTTLATIRYSLLRDWHNRRYAPAAGGIARPPGQLLRGEATPSGATLLFQSAELEVTFLTTQAVRLTWTPGQPPPPYSLAAAETPPPEVETKQIDRGWQISTSDLTVSISPKGEVSFLSAEGDLIRKDLVPIRHGQRWTATSELSPGQALYGLGERSARLNLRPGEYRMWNSDPGGSYQRDHDPLYMCAPLYQSLGPAGSYLLYHENPYDGFLRFDDKAVAEFEGGQLRSLFVLGDPASCLAQLAMLIGRPALPPRWALGYHHSRWGYRDLDEIASILQGFVDHDLPLDVLHLDIDYMDDYRVFTQDPERFPTLLPLADQLKQDHSAKLVVIIDPGVKIDPSYSVYRGGLEADAFCQLPTGEPMEGVVWPGWVHFPDFSNPHAREWWGQQYQRLLDQGVAGFWHDMNEPTSFAAWGELAFPKPTQHVVEGEGGDHRAIHNVYGLLMNRAGFEGLQQLQPDKRPWLLSRSGWAGLARYAWHWTGDTASTWQMLRTTISTVLGLGLSGIPFSGPDIGGFSGDPSRELYLRWFQLAAFMPFFRNHSSKLSRPREPWTMDEEAMRIIRRHLNLRHSFMPYLYTLAEEAHRTGWPMIRPLFWLAAEDESLWDIDDCFLLGDHLLVAPILTEGAVERTVKLPAGDWVDYWTDERHQGPTEISVAGPLDRIPLLVRAGAVLPQQENGELVLHLFPPTPAQEAIQSELYLDEGDGYGPSRHDRFESRSVQNGWRLEWHSEGSYPFPYQQVKLQFHQPLPTTVEIDNTTHELEGDSLQLKSFKRLTATHSN